MNTIPIANINGIEFTLYIPEDYQKKPLPYFNEWVDALDSGNYLQTSGRLCTYNPNAETSYCCLGVLSKVQGLLNSPRDDNYNEYYLSTNNPNYSFFGYNGVFSFGIKVICSTGEEITTLSELNDQGLTFLQISKVIKEIWKSEEELDKVT